jgi:hypothetical protein
MCSLPDHAAEGNRKLLAVALLLTFLGICLVSVVGRRTPTRTAGDARNGFGGVNRQANWFTIRKGRAIAMRGYGAFEKWDMRATRLVVLVALLSAAVLPALAKQAASEVPLSVPTDPKARYWVLEQGGTAAEPTLVTKRIGPIGTRGASSTVAPGRSSTSATATRSKR